MPKHAPRSGSDDRSASALFHLATLLHTLLRAHRYPSFALAGDLPAASVFGGCALALALAGVDRHAAYRISGHPVSVFRLGSHLAMLLRQRKILLCRLLVHACKIFAMRDQPLIFPSPTAYTAGTWGGPDPALFVRPCQLAMPLHCLPVDARQLLISRGDLLMIRASARRFDLLFKASRLDRLFGRATAQNQDRCG